MYGVNDVFDYESDLRNPRKGGTEGALLEPGLHRVVVWAGVVTAAPLLVAMLWLGGTGHPWSWVVLAVSLFAVFAYSVPGLRFKERPVLDSVTSSTHFVSPAVYGLAVAAPCRTPSSGTHRGVLLLGHGQPRVRRRAGRRPRSEWRHRVDRDGLRGTCDRPDRAGALARRGLLMLVTEWPGPLAALLVVPYLVTAWPYRSVNDADSGTANRGWRRFIALNYAVGFLVTMLLTGGRSSGRRLAACPTPRSHRRVAVGGAAVQDRAPRRPRPAVPATCA